MNDNNTQINFKHLEEFMDKKGDFLSIIDFNNIDLQLKPDFFESKTITEFEHSIYEENKLNTLEIIFRTKSGFYIYLSKIDKWDSYYHIKILFKTEQKDEVLFLIKSLNKKTK